MSRARVAVTGGGIAGCSTPYHLTGEGWFDLVLIEQDELTNGTTWHSAAQVTNFGMNQTMVGRKSHSIALNKKLRDDPGYSVGYHNGDGTFRLASTEEQMQGYRHTDVKGLTQHGDDTWTVETDRSSIDADIVVNACGYRVNEIGALMGVHDPVDLMVHQYFVTEDMRTPSMPVTACLC